MSTNHFPIPETYKNPRFPNLERHYFRFSRKLSRITPSNCPGSQNTARNPTWRFAWRHDDKGERAFFIERVNDGAVQLIGNGERVMRRLKIRRLKELRPFRPPIKVRIRIRRRRPRSSCKPSRDWAARADRSDWAMQRRSRRERQRRATQTLLRDRTTFIPCPRSSRHNAALPLRERSSARHNRHDIVGRLRNVRRIQGRRHANRIILEFKRMEP